MAILRRKDALLPLDVVHSMAGRWPDQPIAETLNRMGLTTGQGNTWTGRRMAHLARGSEGVGEPA